ncbi:hypothetical protein ACFYZ5_45040 [Streptomyces chartreusis]|uniref:hypothetical protein n=1 Tax=Streptomyces chartreusis TaxID=1969 RepID=UPI0036933381
MSTSRAYSKRWRRDADQLTRVQKPPTSFGPGTGSNGTISDHSSSDTIHGHD